MDACLWPSQPNPVNPNGTFCSSPMKLFDYMAAGKTILASNYSEIREVLESDSGILLDCWGPDRWVNAIDTLGSEHLQRIGKKAYKSFMENFTLKSRYHHILAAVDTHT